MRYSLLLIPLAFIGLSGCASGGVPASQQTMTTQTIRVSAAGYLTLEQSSDLIVLPGDTTTSVQLRFLSASRLTTRDDWRTDASGDPAQRETTALMTGNPPR
jgi:hypothetical protein